MIQQYPTLEETERHIQHRARFFRALRRMEDGHQARDMLAKALERPNRLQPTTEDAMIIRGYLVRLLVEIPEEQDVALVLGNAAADYVEF